jgi:ribosomal protein L11 methylase PrmA
MRHRFSRYRCGEVGAEKALGVDISDNSAATAIKNVVLNQVSDRLNVTQGSWQIIQQEAYDLTLANLGPSVLLKRGNKIVNHLEKKGRLMVSALGYS